MINDSSRVLISSSLLLNILNSNIYPLNLQNLQALLDYYFPFLPPGNVSQLLPELKGTGIELKDLEHASEKILPFIHFITERLNSSPTQTNILDYAVEIFLIADIDSHLLSPERYEIIRAVRLKSNLSLSCDEFLSGKSRLFFFNNWN